MDFVNELFSTDNAKKDYTDTDETVSFLFGLVS